MLRANVAGSHALRFAMAALAAAVLLVAIGTDPADARRRRFRGGGSYHPPYAAIVVDANSGEVMHAANADAPRHPASITKIMTLYLLFEQMEAGKLRLDSPLQCSANAAAQAPTKLGVRPGQTITVEEAIKSLVTKSANDGAVVVAEALGGDEETFARMMTRKARALGMNNTIYRNASGLPDDEQVTTARDQALLGRAIQDRFPKFYRYFSTASFSFRGRPMRNHNHLLGRVEGVDGIKTGYTRASGFNLVTSVRRGSRHIVAVVLGGASAGSRDARMRQLIEEYIDDAAAQRTVARITERPDATEVGAKPAVHTLASASSTIVPAPAAAREPAPVASAVNTLREDDMRPLPAAQAAPAMSPASLPQNVAAPPVAAQTLASPALSPAHRIGPGSMEPIRPIPVKTLTVRPAAVQTAALAPVGGSQAAAALPPSSTRPGTLGVLPGRQAVASVEPTTPAPASAPAPEVRRSGWIIQVGAFPAEGEAKERLKLAVGAAKRFLGRAEAFTERVLKGETTLYRARFAGLDEDDATAVCKQLKRSKIDCFAVKN
jgi:D-alanyl-D-alanine carboxypeptidase